HRKRISQKLYRKLPHTFAGTHSTQQAWVNSRNPTNIATHWKHRQPIFLHPTLEAGALRPGRLRQRSASWIVILSETLFISRSIWAGSAKCRSLPRGSESHRRVLCDATIARFARFLANLH